ncbi:hypothetical protein C8F04DRAFT_1254472 [Mycena alexandri]|uniref:Uncharacterized protein n=1 Tax=Mycena alexandri TaxID=1745969 RepID=A0AAD6T5V6_9AGAR|nr:hypothetical protein C8F04DRAFT_1254472 [Mycena alexandri]
MVAAALRRRRDQLLGLISAGELRAGAALLPHPARDVYALPRAAARATLRSSMRVSYGAERLVHARTRANVNSPHTTGGSARRAHARLFVESHSFPLQRPPAPRSTFPREPPPRVLRSLLRLCVPAHPLAHVLPRTRQAAPDDDSAPLIALASLLASRATTPPHTYVSSLFPA